MSDIDALYVEFDIPYCALTFSQGLCTATGVPCFNTRNNSHDCGDPANYDATVKTVRFAKLNGYEFWPSDGVPTLTILSDAKSTSAKIDPGKTMGMRATCQITLDNCLSVLSGIDKNMIAREESYAANGERSRFYQGTFLGKFKAITPFIFGSEVRVYRGFVGEEMQVEHYTIDNFSGPNNAGGMVYDCVDFLKLTNGNSSQFPAPTTGVLSADIDTLATGFTALPAGVGDLEYPASGHIAFGKEASSFTRVGDVFTFVERAVKGDLSDHEEGTSVQLVGEYTSQTSAFILHDLITGYTPLSASYVDYSSWNEEVLQFQNALFSAFIVKPESVSKLINELIEQAGLIFYADVKARLIRLKVLRPIASTESIDESIIEKFSQSEIQKDRVSQAWTYYNQKNPFLNLDEETNYFSRVISPTAENLYPTESIKKTFSRWIPSNALSTAVDLNERVIQRYVNPPKVFNFDVPRRNQLNLGQGIVVNHRANEDAFGASSPSPTLITSINYGRSSDQVSGQEFFFTDYTGGGGGVDRIVPIENDPIFNVSLRDIYATFNASLAGVISITFILRAGFYIGSKFNTLPALTVGDFGALVPKLIVESGAYILGAAGTDNVGDNIRAGGLAFDADFPVDVENNGVIGGGGGAGGQGNTHMKYDTGSASLVTIVPTAPSGAGYAEGSKTGIAPYILGIPRVNGDRILGTTKAELIILINSVDNASCDYSQAGDGGDLGQPGSAGTLSAGGAAGKAIKNNANITWTTTGDIRGAIE